jgi:hypothetical protein
MGVSVLLDSIHYAWCSVIMLVGLCADCCNECH